MKMHYLQHVPFEGLGSIERSFAERGYEIKGTHLFETETRFPSTTDVDFLVVMGGPMSVHDSSKYPWLENEKAFIKEYIDTGKPVLGICLGAQLIASALGADVYPNHTKEIGWFPIRGIESRDGSSFSFPDEINVFHWHGETFDLPEGAVRLAESGVCKNQAFAVGDSVLGLQFHLETTPKSAADIMSHCKDELVAGEYIQSEQEILSARPENYSDINLLMEEIIDFLMDS